MTQLIYVSEARDLNLDDIRAVLNISVRKNKLFDISGALIFVEDYFVECLEGEDALIETTYERISKDNRHENVVTISKEIINERFFNDWNLSLVNEQGYKQIVAKYCENGNFNPYFMDKENMLNMLKEVSLVM